jgi:hypothetical protein
MDFSQQELALFLRSKVLGSYIQIDEQFKETLFQINLAEFYIYFALILDTQSCTHCSGQCPGGGPYYFRQQGNRISCEHFGEPIP